MQIICEGLDLCEAVLTVSKAINSKTTNPILEGIKLVAEDDIVTLTATDLELSIEKKIKAEVKQEGEIVVPGKFFSELVKKLTNQKIELKLTENNILKIKYTDSEMVVQCFPVYEFPTLNKIESNDFFGIDQKSFKTIINKTTFCVAVDDTRPILKGCLIEIENNKLRMIALDGYRMAVCTENIKEGKLSTAVVVPARSLNEISKLLADTENIINVYFERSFMMVDLGDCIITTRLIEGDFINYKQILSAEFQTKVSINKKQLEEALERASLLSKIGQNNLVQFEIRDQNLCITSKSEIGNITENINIVLKGSELVIAFNARYFVEALKTTNDEFININFNLTQNPCTITPYNASEDNFTYLILPVRLIR